MLDNPKVNIKIKLAALWTSVMFCYLYADFFGLFSPGQLATMNRGLIPPLGAATDGVMIFVSAMMAVPSLMVFLSIALPARPNRALNALAGAVYAAIISITMWAGALFIFFGIIEIALTLLAVYYAWTWPRAALDSAD
ncbi:MAG TPA: DUF6326 family protein [Allosphingosinicella sp.]|nr:DUF6326 family protein [Allosphingosinicella sp.]